VKNIAGFIQAQTLGLPAYSSTPTWMFLRNSMISDLIFTSLFVFCVHSRRARSALAPAARSRAPRNPACHSRSNATKSKCSR
jgi:hypothetical protein